MDWSSILTPILGAFSATLATVITAFLVKFLKAKTGIVLDENQQKQAREIVQGIEEKAISLLKKGGNKTPGPEKFDKAVTHLLTLNPKLTAREAINQVDRAVGSLPNVGAMTTPSCKISWIPPDRPNVLLGEI
jgi:hypothetical protein